MNNSILNPVVSLEERIQEQLNLLEQDSLSFVVNWIVKNEGFSLEQATKAKNEFLVFISLLHLSDGKLIGDTPIVPSYLADEFWHSFLLFNHKYVQWCKKHFGGVVNHFPGMATKNGWNKFQEATKHYYNHNYSTPGTSSASMKVLDIIDGIDDVVGW